MVKSIKIDKVNPLILTILIQDSERRINQDVPSQLVLPFFLDMKVRRTHLDRNGLLYFTTLQSAVVMLINNAPLYIFTLVLRRTARDRVTRLVAYIDVDSILQVVQRFLQVPGPSGSQVTGVHVRLRGGGTERKVSGSSR